MKEQKFFERYLDNDLQDLATYLKYQYGRIENGELIKGELDKSGAFSQSGSITTQNWYQYNAFQFYYPPINKLFKSVVSMVKEACEYYEIDFESQNYYTHAWFNINYSDGGKLGWHDHGPSGAPLFHGYYCVNAEPSVTHYKVFGKTIDNINKNNRAMLTEMSHPHAMGDWDWEGPRITIAYDVVPLDQVTQQWEQHWIPLS